METHIHIVDECLNFELSTMQLSLVKNSMEIVSMGEPAGTIIHLFIWKSELQKTV